MKRIITYGTFDMFHYGHYNLLKRAKQLYTNSILYVGVSSDKMCKEKGKVPFLNENKRKEIVADLSFVSKVFIEHDMNQKINDVKKYGINVFVLGDDYKGIFPKMPQYEELVKMGVEIIFLDRTKMISSTELKQKLVEQTLLDENKFSIHNLTKHKNN